MLFASLIVIHEQGALALEPDTVSELLVSICKSAFPVHLSFFPLAGVHATIRPYERSASVPLIIFVVAIEYSSVRPSVPTAPIHVAGEPISVKLAPIQPLVCALSLHLVVQPVARVESPIWPEVGAKAVLLSLGEMPVETRPISPALHSLTMVQIVLPHTDVALLAILRLKRSESVCLVVLPVSLIRVTIRAPELPLAFGLIAEPLSLILSPVWPVLHPVGALLAFLVDVARVEGVLKHLDVLHVLQIVLVDHLPKFCDLLTRTAVELLEVLLTSGV